MYAHLIRLEQSPQGALGVLTLESQLFCATLEPDSQDPDRYQIPQGVFLCKRHAGTKYPETFEIQVPGHYDIVFHPGNWESDTKACILLGSNWDNLKGRRAICNSGLTFRIFLKRLEPYDMFGLYVTDNYPKPNEPFDRLNPEQPETPTGLKKERDINHR